MSALERRTGFLQSGRDERGYGRAIGRIVAATDVERTALRAMSTATEAGMTEIFHVKKFQNDLEKICPDAAEALAFIANNFAHHVVRSLNDFSSDIG